MCELRVGQRITVIEIIGSTKNSALLYPIGSTGIVDTMDESKGVVAIIGITDETVKIKNLGWYVYPSDYRVVGTLTVKKLKT